MNPRGLRPEAPEFVPSTSTNSEDMKNPALTLPEDQPPKVTETENAIPSQEHEHSQSPPEDQQRILSQAEGDLLGEGTSTPREQRPKRLVRASPRLTFDFLGNSLEEVIETDRRLPEVSTLPAGVKSSAPEFPSTL